MEINRVTDSFSVAPQIRPEELQALAAQGFTAIICNRPDAEEAGQPSVDTIRLAAAELGMKFHHIPVSGGAFPEDAISRFRSARQQAQGKLLAYCRTGTRSITLDALANPDDLEGEQIISHAHDAGYDLSGLRGRVGK